MNHVTSEGLEGRRLDSDARQGPEGSLDSELRLSSGAFHAEEAHVGRLSEIPVRRMLPQRARVSRRVQDVVGNLECETDLFPVAREGFAQLAAHDLTFEAYDFQDKLIASDAITVTSTARASELQDTARMRFTTPGTESSDERQR